LLACFINIGNLSGCQSRLLLVFLFCLHFLRNGVSYQLFASRWWATWLIHFLIQFESNSSNTLILSRSKIHQMIMMTYMTRQCISMNICGKFVFCHVRVASAQIFRLELFIGYVPTSWKIAHCCEDSISGYRMHSMSLVSTGGRVC
jgi:hypothetical protein